MTKRIIIALLAMLPIGLHAQSLPAGTELVDETDVPTVFLVKDLESGLEYLYDTANPSDGLFIDVSSESQFTLKSSGKTTHDYFFVDAGLRPRWRRNLMNPNLQNTDSARWKKSVLDGITTLTRSDFVDAQTTNNGINTFAGIEYFRNLQTLEITATNYITKLDLSKNTKLTSVTFTATGTKIPNTIEINISNTLLTTFTIPKPATVETFIAEDCPNLTTLNVSGCSSLKELDLDRCPSLASLTLPTDMSKLQRLHLENVPIPTVNLANASNLRELIMKDCQSFTGQITLPNETMELLYLDLRNTNLGSFYTHSDPLDLREYLTLLSFDGTLLFDNNNGTGFIRYLQDDLVTENPDGNIHIHNTNQYELIYYAEGHVDNLDLSGWPYLRKLHIIGDVDRVIIPANRTEFTLSVEDAPNLQADFSTQTLLTKLLVENLNTLDVSGCISLQELVYRDSLSQNLILANDNRNDALVLLDVSESSIKTLDLTGKVPNLQKLTTIFSAVEKLIVSGHTNLNDLNLYTDEAATIEKYGSLLAGSEAWPLHYLDISGCTGLTAGTSKNLDITSSNTWNRYCNIDTLLVRNIPALEKLTCNNSLLKYLDLSGCTNLQELNISQGMLTGNGDINITGCNDLTSFVANRQHWESLDFLLDPAVRSSSAIAKLEQLQVNGGSYTLQDEHGTPILRSDSLLYTTHITELNLSAATGLTTLLCEDNLLTQLDLSQIGANLEFLQCARNMLITMDLHALDPTKLNAESNWSPQVGYISAKIIRASGKGEDSRKKDWVALHLENGGYTHSLDNNMYLYPNLYDARHNLNPIAEQDNAWMCRISETADIADFAGCNFDATAYDSGEYLFVHSMAALLADNGGKYVDHELDGKVVLGQFNTGFNQDTETAPNGDLIPKLDGNGDIVLLDPSCTLNPHIEVRVHLWPHMININPATMSGPGVDYYSSTLMLDYDAVIPEGVECYFISGVTDDYVTGAANVGLKFEMTLVGGDGSENKILPANTPVYIRSTEDLGLYDFQPVWEFDYLGWENLRGSEDHTLHGVESETTLKTKPEYEAALAKAKTDLPKIKNILSGHIGEKNETTDVEAEGYNIYKSNDGKMTVTTPILTLGRDTKGSKSIGFWPFTGTGVTSHRCYITKADYDQAIDDYKQTAANPVSNASSIQGMTFNFGNSTTGITTVTTTENSSDVWYTLDGQRLNSMPTQKGVYINNGKKVIIR